MGNPRSVHSTARIHEHALVDRGAHVGARTRVWAFAHLLPGSEIGEDCNICDHTFIEGAVKVGNRVTIKCGIYLWDGTIVEDDVFLGPNVVLTNDRNPRSRVHLKEYPLMRLRKGASIGANATLLPGIEIGEYALVGAGSVVTQSVPAYALVIGNPARPTGWVCRCGQKLIFKGKTASHCEWVYAKTRDGIEVRSHR